MKMLCVQLIAPCTAISPCLGDTVLTTFDTWMQLMAHIITTPALPPSTTPPVSVTPAPANLASPLPTSSLEAFKCKKWAVQIIHGLFRRYGYTTNFSRLSESEQYLGKSFLQNWASQFAKQFITLLRQENIKKDNNILTDRTKRLILEYFRDSVEVASVYKTVKTDIEFLLFEENFLLLYFNERRLDDFKVG